MANIISFHGQVSRGVYTLQVRGIIQISKQWAFGEHYQNRAGEFIVFCSIAQYFT